MAIDDTTTQPAPTFTWGGGGVRLTPDEIAARRKVADALAAQGMDSSAFPVGTRGAGLLTQGLARLAKGISAGLDYREADQAAKANADDSKTMLTALLGGGSATPAPTAAVPTAAAAPAPTAAADTSVPRGIRNNNALNIEDGDFAKGQPGYSGTDGRFARFETPDQGTAAANALLDVYQQKHGLNTVAGIVNRWAPASDGNNVSAYATDVAHQLGVDPNAPLTEAQRPALIAAMGRHENGRPIPIPVLGAPSTTPVVAADDDEEATPAAATPPGVAKVTAAMPGGADPLSFAAPSQPAPAAPAAVTKVAAAMPGAPVAAPAAAPAPAAATPGTARVQAALQAFTSPYADAQTKQVAGMILQQAMKPKAAAPYKDAEGNLLQVGPDNLVHKIVDAQKDPASVQEYEYAKSHADPSKPFMSYPEWTIQKARAAATSINNVGNTTSETEMSKAVGKAQGEVIGEDIKAGAHASTKLRQLATLDEANKSGGDDISSGPFGKAILSGKQGLSELTGVDLKGVPESEVIQKVGFGLATNMVKAVSNRPSQMEFGKALENVPGLLMSKQGRIAMTSILTQEARAEQDIGRLANHSENHADWQGVKDKYYEAHPLISPFTGKPFGDTDIQMLTKAGDAVAGSTASPTAPAGIDPAAIEEARRRKLIP